MHQISWFFTWDFLDWLQFCCNGKRNKMIITQLSRFWYSVKKIMCDNGMCEAYDLNDYDANYYISIARIIKWVVMIRMVNRNCYFISKHPVSSAQFYCERGNVSVYSEIVEKICLLKSYANDVHLARVTSAIFPNTWFYKAQIMYSCNSF